MGMPEASVHGTESAHGSLATLPLLFSKHDLCVSISVGMSGIFTSLFSSFGEKGLEHASLTLTYLNLCSKNTRCLLIQFLSSWCDKLSQTWTESHCWWLESGSWMHRRLLTWASLGSVSACESKGTPAGSSHRTTCVSERTHCDEIAKWIARIIKSRGRMPLLFCRHTSCLPCRQSNS